MLNGVAAQNGAFAGALWHNAPNLKLYAKCGWTDLSRLRTWVLVVDPRRNVEARLGPGALSTVLSAAVKPLLALQRALRPAGRATSCRVEEIARFDAAMKRGMN